MKTNFRFAGFAMFALATTLGTLHADDWPGFRGTRGGVADDKNLPTKLSKDNVLWTVKLPGPGTSSPIVYGDKVFVTAYTGYGSTISKGFAGGGGGGFGKGKGGPDTGGDQKKLRFQLLCFDRHDGKLLWKSEVEPKLPEQAFSGFMREHGYTSSTPVTDGERVYAFFGKTGVLAFDMTGKQLWQTSVGTGVHMWGSATSPILHENLVIVNAAIESKSLIALDKTTGNEVWRQSGMGSSWSSPILVETKDQKPEIIVSITGKIVGYEPATGKELWHCQGIGGAGGGGGGGGGGGKGGFGGGYTASTPVTRDGIVYIIGGGGPSAQATSIAVKAGGRGDVNKSHVLWRQKAGASSCSPVLSGNFLYFVDGTVTCLDLDDGKVVYKERLYGSKNEYSSPVAADGKVFAMTRFDGIHVLKGGSTFEKLGHYDFKGDTSIFNATPAIANGRLYVRSNENLYCIGNTK